MQTLNNKNIRFFTPWTTVLLGGLILIGLWLRAVNLGTLGIFGDEDHTYFAVKGILEHGLPYMPSGMLYPRAPLLSYFAAFFSATLGFDETSLRLPSVILSTLNLLLYSYLFFKLVNRKTALVFAALFTVSYWNIEVARQARMYEMMLFFQGLSALLISKGFLEKKSSLLWLSVLTMALAISTQKLAFFLNSLYLLPFLFKQPLPLPRKHYFLIVACSLLVQVILIKLMGIPYEEALEGKIVAVEDGNSIGNIITNLFSHGELNYLELILSASLILIVLLAISRKNIAASTKTSLEEKFLLLTLMTCVTLNVLGVFVWILAIHLFRRGQGFSGALNTIPAVCVGILLAFSLWLAFTSDKGIITALKDAFNYPHWIILRLFEVFPVLTMFALIGTAQAFHFATRKKNIGFAIVLVGFLSPMIGIGLFEEYPRVRYLYSLLPFMICLAIFPILEISEALIKQFKTLTLTREILSCGVALLVALSTFEGFSIPESKGISERTYHTKLNSFLYPYETHPDHKTTGQFVRTNAEADAVVIVMDFISAAYTERANYLLRTGTILGGIKATREIFLNVPIINSLQEFKALIAQADRTDKELWLVTSQELIGPHRTSGLSPLMMEFLDQQSARIRYVGKDKVTNVYSW